VQESSARNSLGGGDALMIELNFIED